MVCTIQCNIAAFKIIVQITLGVKKQQDFTNLFKNLNAFAGLATIPVVAAL